MRYSLLLVLPLVLGASGCASTVEPPPAPDQPVNATVVWGNSGHGGAAGRVPGYVHAFAKEATFRPRSEAPVKIAATANYATATPSRAATPKPVQISPSVRDPIVDALAAAMEQPAPEVAPLPAQRSAQSQSRAAVANADDQLRNAWEKYCRGGADMSDEEWHLVREASAPQNVPPDLAEGCVHPK